MKSEQTLSVLPLLPSCSALHSLPSSDEGAIGFNRFAILRLPEEKPKNKSSTQAPNELRQLSHNYVIYRFWEFHVVQKPPSFSASLPSMAAFMPFSQSVFLFVGPGICAYRWFEIFIIFGHFNFGPFYGNQKHINALKSFLSASTEMRCLVVGYTIV